MPVTCVKTIMLIDVSKHLQYCHTHGSIRNIAYIENVSDFDDIAIGYERNRKHCVSCGVDRATLDLIKIHTVKFRLM